MIKYCYLTSSILESHRLDCQERSQFCNTIPTINPAQQRTTITELLSNVVTSLLAHYFMC